MASSTMDNLSRREREVIQVIYRLGEASATEVQACLATSTKNAATRKILTALLEKGAIKRRREGKRYIYCPTKPARSAGSSAMAQVLQTFFKGSVANGLMGIVELGKEEFTEDELAQIRAIVKDKT